MKTKKIKEMAKKIKLGNEDEKALIKKKRPGKVLRTAAEKDPAITERKKAESQMEAALKAMVKSENRFRSIFESSRDAIMTLEPPNWKFTSGNPAALKMFMAKDEADFDSHEPWTLSPERQPDGRASAEKAKEMIEIAMRDGSNFFEWTHKRLNGDEFPATILLTRMVLVEKTLIQATVRDITERKREESQREAALEALQTSHDELECRVQERTAELAQANEMLKADIIESKRAELQKKEALEALRRSEENFHRSLEDSPLGVRVLTANGETIYANKVLLDIYGYSNVEELNKIPLKERYTPQSYAEFRIRKKARERGDFGPSEYEIAIVRKNGEIRHLQVLRKEVLWNGTKQFQVIYQDISERKRAEEVLRISEEKYRLLVENAAEAILIAQDGMLKFVNHMASEMTGYSMQELLSSPFLEFIHPDDRNMVGERYLRRLTGDVSQPRYSFRLVARDGSIKWVEIDAVLVDWEDRPATLNFLSDISDRKQAEMIQHIQYKIANAMIKAETLSDFLETVRKELSSLIDTTNFLVAIYDETSGLLSAPFERDEKDAIPQWPAEKSLTGLVLKQKRSLLLSGEEIQQLDQAGTTEVIGSRAEAWLGVPLLITNKVLGAIVVQSYDNPDAYDQSSVNIMEMIASQLSVYIERKRAEEALHENEERMRAIVEGTPHLFFYTQDAEANITYVSPTIEHITGYKTDIWQKRKDWFITDATINQVAKERTHANLRGEFTEEPQLLEVHHAIGHPILLEIYEYPITKNGRVVGLQGVAHDITQRKRAESQRQAALEALRESEEKYRTLFTSSSDAIMLIEPLSGKFISGNQTTMEMFGLKNDDDFSSFGPWDFSPERQPDEHASAEKAKEMNEIAMRDGSNFFEWAHKRLNGEEFSANVRLTRIVLDKKTILQATVRDITERKQAEEKIKNSLAEKEVLLKEVHHRVKNNLMTIIGLIKMQGTKANIALFNPLLLELEGRVRAMALVHESLHKSADLARITLQNYIETMSAHIRAQFGAERDIRFLVRAVGVDVNLDIAVPCGLILNELVTNAYKHAFPGDKPGSRAGKCEINIVANQEGDMLTLTVADNGVGLPADLDWEKSETLGLRLIKMLSQQLNGSIELDRTSGTTFHLRFAYSSAAG